MARNTGQERGTTNISTNTNGNTSDKAVTPSGGSPVSRLLAGAGNFLSPSRVNRPQGAAGARPAQNKGVWRRIFIGMFVFIVGAQVFEYVLLFVDQRFFNLTLEKNMVAASSVPLLGSMNIFTFIYLLFILLLYIGLLRFNVLPSSKDLRNQRAQTTSATTTAASSGASRSARKRAARQSASSASVHAATTTARVKSGQTGQHDDVYERVKAAQRQRRRRETKR